MFYKADLQSQTVRDNSVAEQVNRKAGGKYGKMMPSWDQRDTVKTEIRFVFSRKFIFQPLVR